MGRWIYTDTGPSSHIFINADDLSKVEVFEEDGGRGVLLISHMSVPPTRLTGLVERLLDIAEALTGMDGLITRKDDK